ncbi:MAG: hypothetical protein JWR09_5203 [Mucilaginibacter sp.]|nr:hypothetical protein [Mucilaginibacter sp.]
MLRWRIAQIARIFYGCLVTSFNSFHFLDWLFRKQISERRAEMPRPVPCGFAEKKSSLPAPRRGIFFRKVLSFSPPCSGEGAYKKPPEAASRGVLIKKQTGELWKQQTAERHHSKKQQTANHHIEE